MITTIHHNLPTNIAKQVVKSVIGSLNATAIAYARGHLRFNAVENIADRVQDRVPTIDDFNDAQAAIAESEQRVEAAGDMGFEVQMQSGELAERLILLRNWFAAWLDQNKATQNDVPLTIAETIKFQITRPNTTSDEAIELLAAAVEIDPALLKAAQLKMVTDDTSDLKQNAGKVLTFLEAFRGDNFDERDVEQGFNALPAHVQYKLMSAAIRAHDKARQKALQSLLRGKLEAAGDIKLITGHRDELLAWLVTFSKAKRVALDAYMERGGQLMEIEDREIVTSNTKQPTNVGIDMSKTSTYIAEAAKAPMAPIGSCDVTPKVIGKARRAPAPQA